MALRKLTLHKVLFGLGYVCGMMVLNTQAIAQHGDHDGHDHGGDGHNHAHGEGGGGEGMMDPAMMEAWGKFMTPGAPHEGLKYFVGEWNWTSKMWMAPGAPPMEGTGTSSSKMIFGGRYLQDEVHGIGGMPFEGRGVTGYDNAKKKYCAVWFDTLGTGFMMSEGTVDASGKQYSYRGSYVDPMGKKKMVRSVYKIINDDKYTLEMYDQDKDGKEFRNFELIITRK